MKGTTHIENITPIWNYHILIIKIHIRGINPTNFGAKIKREHLLHGQHMQQITIIIHNHIT